jgi:hypothetical protein
VLCDLSGYAIHQIIVVKGSECGEKVSIAPNLPFNEIEGIIPKRDHHFKGDSLDFDKYCGCHINTVNLI